MAVTINASTTTGLVQSADTSGIIELQNNGTTKLTVNSGGVTIPTLTTTTISDGTNSTSATNPIRGSARAWVSFNGTGTIAINSSFNVSSLTDNGTGDYTINFTTAMPSATFVAVTTGGDTASGTGGRNYNTTIAAKTTTTVEIVSALTSTGSATDCPAIDVAVFSS
jgi:hypothetical protein